MCFFSLALAVIVAVASMFHLWKYSFAKRTDQKSLFPRQWTTVSTTSDDSRSFVMMTFNLLADGLSGIANQRPDKLFVGVPTQVLDWTNRFEMIVEEILRVSPDVLCVQECDHVEMLSDSLQIHGYDFQFQYKDFSPVLKLNADGKPDGVGIFFKRDKFQLIDVFKTRQARHKKYIQDIMTANPKLFSEQTIRISDLFESISRMEDNTRAQRSIEMLLEDIGWTPEKLRENDDRLPRPIFDEWMNRPTNFPVSVAVRLRPRGQSNDPAHMVVLTTHLSSKKAQDGEETRLVQVQDLFGCEMWKAFAADADVFVGGDLNCSPHREDYDPLVYRHLVRDGRVDETSGGLPKPFRSAMLECLGQEPEYSTWKHREKRGRVHEAKHTIDFLLFGSSAWSASRYFSIPTEDDVQLERERAARELNLESLPSALPCARYPSDHFALAVEFAMQ